MNNPAYSTFILQLSLLNSFRPLNDITPISSNSTRPRTGSSLEEPSRPNPSLSSLLNPIPLSNSPNSLRTRPSSNVVLNTQSNPENLLSLYYRQIIFGCQYNEISREHGTTCTGSFCRSNPNFLPRDTRDAFQLAHTLANNGRGMLCRGTLCNYWRSMQTSTSPQSQQSSFSEYNYLSNESGKKTRQKRKSSLPLSSAAPITSTSYKPLSDNFSQLSSLNMEQLIHLNQESQRNNDGEKFATMIYTVFSRLDLLAKSFCQRDPVYAAFCPVDLDEVKLGYQYILYQCPSVVNAAMMSGISHLLLNIMSSNDPILPYQLPALLIILLNPSLNEQTSHLDILPRLCHVLATLPDPGRLAIGVYLCMHRPNDQGNVRKAHDFRYCLEVFQNFITTRLTAAQRNSNGNVPRANTPNRDEHVMKATVCLSILYTVNQKYHLVDYKEFYNIKLNETIEIKEDYPRYKSQEGFSFCNYAFILNPHTKSDILKVESMVQMRSELQDAFFRAMFVGMNSPYLVLEVRREHLIRDALFQLVNKASQELKKQLRVQFTGEEGVDEGGVQKEFFQLLIRDLFEPQYGMFKRYEDTRRCWFVSNPNEEDSQSLDEFKLVGRLIGLAIYNSVILDLHFPLALYKKLLNHPVTLKDLEELDMPLAQGLKGLLQFEGDVESVYSWTFQIEYEVFGQRHHYDLIPNGDNIPLTNQNRKQFVDLYVDFVLNKSIEKQFEAFKEGFDHVCANTVIKLFRPEEVELMVCGSSELDFEALEKVTHYDGGFTPDSPVIKYFWQTVHEFTMEQKRKLLFFATGSDRVPMGGLGKLQFVIAKNGPDSDRLPTSHTCFNVLLLPEYRDMDKLKSRLLTAIENSVGFGMI